MRKVLAYIFCVAATCAVLWFSLIVATMSYGEEGRWKYILGLGLSLVVALVLAAYGNSLPWKKKDE